MAELATIARPYADALFKAQTADLAGTAAWLDELAAVASNSQLLQFSENPKVTDAQVFDLISGVVKNTLPAAALKQITFTSHLKHISAHIIIDLTKLCVPSNLSTSKTLYITQAHIIMTFLSLRGDIYF